MLWTNKELKEIFKTTDWGWGTVSNITPGDWGPVVDITPPKLIVEVWNKCPSCQKDFRRVVENPIQKDFDDIAEHLNKDIPLCPECSSYYDE